MVWNKLAIGLQTTSNYFHSHFHFEPSAVRRLNVKQFSRQPAFYLFIVIFQRLQNERSHFPRTESGKDDLSFFFENEKKTQQSHLGIVLNKSVFNCGQNK